jgi:hypothetical protein
LDVKKLKNKNQPHYITRQRVSGAVVMQFPLSSFGKVITLFFSPALEVSSLGILAEVLGAVPVYSS